MRIKKVTVLSMLISFKKGAACYPQKGTKNLMYDSTLAILTMFVPAAQHAQHKQRRFCEVCGSAQYKVQHLF